MKNFFPGIMLINDLCFELDIYSVVCIILQVPFFADILNLDFEPAKELEIDSKKSIYEDIEAIVQHHAKIQAALKKEGTTTMPSKTTGSHWTVWERQYLLL